MSNSWSKGTALITGDLGASELFIPSKCFIFKAHFPTYSQTRDRKELNEGIACIHSNDQALQIRSSSLLESSKSQATKQPFIRA
jgi:hypothetical protein